ncbi:hypothetical protein U9M48_007514 [Paspalum notatum var. saurae]|uniref:Cytochrome P450 n=1 Tax=Paspalum notatum var. saurae TaxID=547442 RepID=A0AAQ3SMI4_PASNO
MEAIVAEPAVEGQEPKTPSEAVAQVLSSSKFLQNVGLEPTATKRNGKAIVAARIQDLEDELEAEKLGAAAVRDELEALKKKIPIVTLHRDKEVWGSDAGEFNPMRFKNGVSRAARDPNALLTFSLGPRACIGQSFAIIEAQVVMAIVLSKFSLSLSPAYTHKPKYAFSLVPNRGMPLILRSLEGVIEGDLLPRQTGVLE